MTAVAEEQKIPDFMGPTDPIIEARAREKLIKARIALLIKNSFFGNLAVRLRMKNADDWCETAATDGQNFYYNSRFIDYLTPDELIFLVGHEVLHVVYDHLGRRNDRNPKIWNIADDYAVNADLIRHKIGEMITSVPCLYEKKYDQLPAEMIYDDLMKNVKQIDIEALAEKLLDEHLEGKQADGKELSQGERDEIKREIRQSIIHSAETSKPGEVPGKIARMIKEITTPTMNWRDLLNANLISTFRNDYSWNRVSRRGWHTDAVLPGMVPGEMIKIAVAIDMSGSISNQQASMFLGEIRGIMEAFDNYEIYVLSFDTKVYNPQTFRSENLEDINEYEPKGGGGTNFDCIFKHLTKKGIEPDRLVVFTDGYTCNWGDPNYCDTTWIIHGVAGDVVPPWGTWAYLDKQNLSSGC